MTDAQTVVAAIAGAAGTIAGAIAGAIRWSTRKKTKSTDQATAALVENAKSLALLSARIDALDRQSNERSEATRKELVVNVSRLEAALADVQVIAARLERTAETLERDSRLDDSQRAKLAKIRTKIARGLSAGTPVPRGEDGDGGGG